MPAIAAFISALILNLLFIPVIRRLSIQYGAVSIPRDDRWNRLVVPTMGGVGIFLSFLIGLIAYRLLFGTIWSDSYVSPINPIFGFIGGSLIMFLLGLFDDFYRFSPPAKLVVQILAASVVIAVGFTTDFFTPRIENVTIAQSLNVIFTILWIVGISNAINLLDNMDGLAGGISFITAILLSVLFWMNRDLSLLVISLALAGSILGFLVYNFPPAKIFMGDSGSLFLGYTLAVLAIARQPQASNVLAVLGVPTLLLLLPILDTIFVTITRILRGESPVRGGSDHTSHRLIAFGLTERQAVLFLYVVALVAGVMAVSIESIGYWLSLLFVPILIVGLAVLTAYLAGLKIISTRHESLDNVNIASRFLQKLTYERRLFEILLDALLVIIALYMAILIDEDFVFDQVKLLSYIKMLPLALISTFLSFVLFGVYRGIWKFVSLGDVLRYFGAVITSVFLFTLGAVLLFQDESVSTIVIVLFGIFLFIGLIVTRFSFRILDLASFQLRYTPRENNKLGKHNHSGLEEKISSVRRVLIYGAGNRGDIAVRWLRSMPDAEYLPVGFIDRDPTLVGRIVSGIEVLGTEDQLIEIIEETKCDGVILTEENMQEAFPEEIVSECTTRNCWIRVMKFSFEMLNEE